MPAIPTAAGSTSGYSGKSVDRAIGVSRCAGLRVQAGPGIGYPRPPPARQSVAKAGAARLPVQAKPDRARPDGSVRRAGILYLVSHGFLNTRSLTHLRWVRDDSWKRLRRVRNDSWKRLRRVRDDIEGIVPKSGSTFNVQTVISSEARNPVFKGIYPFTARILPNGKHTCQRQATLGLR